MVINYQYKQYPCSKKATAYSHALGILTSWPVKLLCVAGVTAVLMALFMYCGMEDGIALCVSLLPGLAILYPFGLIKRFLQKRIDRRALRDLAMNDPEILQTLKDFMHTAE